MWARRSGRRRGLIGGVRRRGVGDRPGDGAEAAGHLLVGGGVAVEAEDVAVDLGEVADHLPVGGEGGGEGLAVAEVREGHDLGAVRGHRDAAGGESDPHVRVADPRGEGDAVELAPEEGGGHGHLDVLADLAGGEVDDLLVAEGDHAVGVLAVLGVDEEHHLGAVGRVQDGADVGADLELLVDVQEAIEALLVVGEESQRVEGPVRLQVDGDHPEGHGAHLPGGEVGHGDGVAAGLHRRRGGLAVEVDAEADDVAVHLLDADVGGRQATVHVGVQEELQGAGDRPAVGFDDQGTVLVRQGTLLSVSDCSSLYTAS